MGQAMEQQRSIFNTKLQEKDFQISQLKGRTPPAILRVRSRISGIDPGCVATRQVRRPARPDER